MEVCSSAMGPERVLPNSDNELGEEERPADGGLLPVWSGGEGGGEEEVGGEVQLDGDEEEEEEEEVNSGGYYYQPLNQDPDGMNGSEPAGEGRGEEQDDSPSNTEQLQQVQHRIQVMGLHLPEAPSADSDEEDDSEGAAALRSRASIPMDADHVELVKRTMAAVALPSLGVPPWAQEISEDQWKDMVQTTLETRQATAGLHLPRRSNITGP